MDKEPKPGEFVNGEGIERESGETTRSKEIKNIEVKLESAESLVQAFEVFKNSFNPKADLIYYPCSGQDISIAESFPESRIVFLDRDEKVINALQKAGYEAVKESVQDFKLKLKADIMLLYNPGVLPTEIMIENLNQKGYLLCNNYHGTASLLKERDDFELNGVIGRGKDSLILDTENLEDYWKDIDSEEEFENVPFSLDLVSYEFAKRVVEKRVGKTENILEEYKKLIESAKEATRKQNEEFFIKNPDFDQNSIPDENSNPLMWRMENGELQMIITELPKKKGTVDDTFVFSKKEKINK